MGAGRIKGITIELEGNTTKLVNSMRDIDSQLKNTQTALRDVNKLLKMDPGNTELLAQKQKQLTTSIEQTKTRLNELKTAQSQVSEGTSEWDALQREIAETENNLKNLEKEYRNFGSVAAQEVAAVGEKVKGFGTKVSEFGKDLTTHVTAPLVAIGTVGTKKFADVDKTMKLVESTMGKTKWATADLDSAMKSAAANSTFGMNDAAQASLNFARAGLDAEQAADTLAPAMNLAAAEGGNLDTVSNGLVATINGFGDEFGNAEHYADIFANACNNSALEINSLSSAMSIAAPIFNAAGYSVKDAALYMGVMGNAGIEASVAANALKTGMARLVSPTKNSVGWMERLGISVTDGNGKMKDTVTLQAELHEAFSTLSEDEQLAAASAIFGKNQMSNWLALINTAPEDVRKLSGALDEEGTTARQAEDMMSGFGGSMEKLKSSIDVAATSLGESLAPTISKVADIVQKGVDWFNSLDEGQQQFIAKTALAVAAIGPLLMVGGRLLIGVGQLMTYAPKIVSFGTMISKGAGIAKTAIGGLSFNPVVLGIGAAVVAGVAIYKNWDKIKEGATKLKDHISQKWNEFKTKTSETWESAKNTMSTKTEAAKNAVTSRIEQMRSSASQKYDSMKNDVAAKTNSMKTSIDSNIESMKTSVVTQFESLRASAGSRMESMKTSVKSKAESIKDNTVTMFDSMKTSVISKIESMKSSAVDKWDSMKSSAKTKFKGIKSEISDKITDARDKVKDMIDSMKEKLNFRWSLPKLELPHFSISGQFSLDPLEVPSFDVDWYRKAYGHAIEFKKPTIVPTAAGLKGFGDGPGAEIVAGKSGLMKDMTNAVERANLGNYTFNIYTQPGQDPEEIAREVEKVLIRKDNRRKAAFA